MEALRNRFDEQEIRLSEGHMESTRALEDAKSREGLMRFTRIMKFFSDFIYHFAVTAKNLYNVLKRTGFSKMQKRGRDSLSRIGVQVEEKSREEHGRSMKEG